MLTYILKITVLDLVRFEPMEEIYFETGSSPNQDYPVVCDTRLYEAFGYWAEYS